MSSGKTLEECANKYRNFCKKYRPNSKPKTRNHWGNKPLGSIKSKSKRKNKPSPEQMELPWDTWEPKNEEVEEVAEKFIFANCYNPQFVGSVLQNSCSTSSDNLDDQYQVSESQNP